MFLKLLLPDLYVDSIYHIDLAALKNRGIKGIITDLDNTLIEWDRPSATPDLEKWFEEVNQAGFKLVIVSNNNSERVGKFAQPLGLPFIHNAKKPFRFSFERAQEMMGLKAEEVVVIGDQLFTDILGGNRHHLYTILVLPVAQTDGFFTRFNRRMEKIALQKMRKKGLITWDNTRRKA